MTQPLQLKLSFTISASSTLITMGFLSWLFSSRSSKNNTTVAEWREITLGMKTEGFVDLDFSLATYERIKDGTQTCTARGTYNGAEAGFRVRLPPQWKQGTLGNTGITTYQASVVLESLGAASDRFIVALGDLYGGTLRPTSMVSGVTFTAISLEGNPAALEKGATKIKLFFEPMEDSEETQELFYAEHYLNIDLGSRTVEFHEKDESYREAILRALSGETRK